MFHFFTNVYSLALLQSEKSSKLVKNVNISALREPEIHNLFCTILIQYDPLRRVSAKGITTTEVCRCPSPKYENGF